MSNTLELDRRAALGVLGGAAVAATRSRTSRRADDARPIAFWLADRDGDRVVGLTDALDRRIGVDIRCPLAVQPAGGRGVWVLGACRRTAADPRRRLLRIGEDGGVRGFAELSDAPVMRAGTRGSVWVLSRGGRGLLHFDANGACKEHDLPERCHTFAVTAGGALLVATRSGTLLSRNVNGEWSRAACLERFPLDVAPHPEGWWVLGRDRIARLDCELEVAYAVALDDSAGRLVVDASGTDPSAVWHLANDRIVRVAPGERRVWAGDWPLAGVSAAAVSDGAGVVVAPGAVLAFDRSGRARSGQGGFRHLVDVASVLPELGA